ncbi:MAG: M14 family zinc carboxypeptidase [Bacteroidota bacterium]
MPRCSFAVRCLASVALGVLLALPTSAQEERGAYAEVCFAQPMADLVRDLAWAGVGLDHAHRHRTPTGVETCAVFNAAEQGRLAATGIAHRTAVPDLEATYAAQRPLRQAMLQALRDPSVRSQAFDLDRFEFGSMGGYYTFDEVVAKLDQLHTDFPDLITEKTSIGTTGEGRAIWMVEIGNSPGVDEGEPEVLYTAIHHAREPQSMTTVLYFMIYLLENYGTDPEVTYLVDNRRLTFVPILNPDGYVYNEATNPDGGGFWRKNRRPNEDGSFGVDLNRNYGFEWAYDNEGSSPSPFSDTYRGPEPFSEPETAALRDFVEGRQFETAFNYHSFSNLLIYPWGYKRSFYTPDSARFVDFAALMTAENDYLAGTGDQTVGYVVNGDSDDWFYGEQTTKNKIYAFTPEVGTRDDFFWPFPDRIEPLAQENIDANLLLAWVAGGFPVASLTGVTDRKLVCNPPQCGNDYVDPGEVMEVTLAFENIGLGPVAGAAYRIVSTNPIFTPLGEDGSLALAMDATASVTLDVQVDAGAPLGLADGLAVEIDLGGATRTYPLGPLLIGTERPVFEDEARSLDAWSTQGNADWGLTTVALPGFDSVFTDSPDGPYLDNTTAALVLAEPLDLSAFTDAILSFDTRWDIEAGYDGGQVLVSTDGVSFAALEGRHTTPGQDLGGVQQPGEPYYDGAQPDWVRETIDLSAYTGEAEVTVAFQLQSDPFVVGDGWYVDNVRVSELISIFDVDAEATPELPALRLAAPYPNPTQGDLVVAFTLPATTDLTLEVFDVLGRRVAVLAEGELAAGAHSLTWDGRTASGRTLSAGAYVLRLVADGQVQTQRFVRVRE